MDFVWVFHKIRHEALPTLRKVHKYKQTQSKEVNNLDLEQQADEVLSAEMKYLKIGRAEGLKLPFVASVNTEENKEASNALTIVKKFSRIKL